MIRVLFEMASAVEVKVLYSEYDGLEQITTITSTVAWRIGVGCRLKQ